MDNSRSREYEGAGLGGLMIITAIFLIVVLVLAAQVVYLDRAAPRWDVTIGFSYIAATRYILLGARARTSGSG